MSAVLRSMKLSPTLPIRSRSSTSASASHIGASNTATPLPSKSETKPGSVQSGNEVLLPWPPRVLSPNARTHWAVKSKAARDYRKLCRLLASEAGLRGIDWDGTVHLWITFLAPDRRGRDDDNMIASFKHGRDGLADALGIDDKRFRIHPWVSDEVVKGGAVRICLTPGADGALTA